MFSKFWLVCEELCHDFPLCTHYQLCMTIKETFFSLLRFVFLFSRQYRLERELKSRLWKIDYNQLGFERRASNTSLASAMVCFFDPQETLIMSDINAPTGLQNF